MTGLYLRVIGANMVGLVTVLVLNYLTPSDVLLKTRSFLLGEGRLYLLFIHPLIVLLIVGVQHAIQRPIAQALGGGLPRQGEAADRIRRRLLNLPFLVAGVNLFLWILISSLITFVIHLTQHVPGKISLFILFRTLMIGLIAAHLSFFLVEEFARRRLIPRFFPEGRLAGLPGTWSIPIHRRIQLLYLAGISIPMLILVGTLAFIDWQGGDAARASGGVGREILYFTLFLCGAFVVIGLRLNVLVGRSIVEPVLALLKVMTRVRAGSLDQRVPVLSNDEIGVLGDTGNEMIEALVERERIRETFGRYITPEIRDQILEGRIPLDGERREATLLFADLRGFTRYVEESPPEEVIRSMREYFTAMEQAVRRWDGLILQYVGDEIESVFGIPLHPEGHARRAVCAALEMRRLLEALNMGRAARGLLPFQHGIGIHTGWVLAGNTGSEGHPAYGLIGDPVNVASRIQELTKVLGCDILISEDTVRALGQGFSLEQMPPQTIRGTSRSIQVHRLKESCGPVA